MNYYEQKNTKPWHSVEEGEWAYGHAMPCRIKFEQLKLVEKFGNDVTFGTQDGERYIEVRSNELADGHIVIWLSENFPMEAPAINSVNIKSHGLWAPKRRMVEIIMKEYDLRALAYTEANSDDWHGDAFDSKIIGSVTISG